MHNTIKRKIIWRNMMDKQLSKINFSEILMYPEISGYQKEYVFKCTGFCISCEEKGFVKNG
jgi:hypothetical protein